MHGKVVQVNSEPGGRIDLPWQPHVPPEVELLEVPEITLFCVFWVFCVPEEPDCGPEVAVPDPEVDWFKLL